MTLAAYHLHLYERFEEYLERGIRLREVDEALRLQFMAGVVKTYLCKRKLREEKRIGAVESVVHHLM
jgi:hypothetical protein